MDPAHMRAAAREGIPPQVRNVVHQDRTQAREGHGELIATRAAVRYLLWTGFRASPSLPGKPACSASNRKGLMDLDIFVNCWC